MTGPTNGPPGEPIPRALTIAGSDSGGGAGIQADLKTFAALGVYGASAITALTAQNTVAVTRVEEVSPAMVTAQIDAVLDDLGADAIKTGMLASAAIVEAVADALARRAPPRLVVDPVMVSKSGAALLQDDAVDRLVRRLLPLALVVTPNLPEAARLTGLPVLTMEERRAAARAIAATGPRFVVVKGGHAPGDTVIDLVYDGREFEEVRGPRIDTRSTHGTGCTFSAAIAAHLALGLEPQAAIRAARAYLTEALRAARPIGRGVGPVEHFPGRRGR
ncbi:MAG TPA: bifunctional hydroxymethylpyrimidine kinase/phosphomethylpyrimidine kinase [Dongiaceae bacterium]|nr:bifunctional hydroxymethylpyrimidine kinase/phosphomethylpyrimidine kinase [Dongiaceae bacterium]